MNTNEVPIQIIETTSTLIPVIPSVAPTNINRIMVPLSPIRLRLHPVGVMFSDEQLDRLNVIVDTFLLLLISERTSLKHAKHKKMEIQNKLVDMKIKTRDSRKGISVDNNILIVDVQKTFLITAITTTDSEIKATNMTESILEGIVMGFFKDKESMHLLLNALRGDDQIGSLQNINNFDVLSSDEILYIGTTELENKPSDKSFEVRKKLNLHERIVLWGFSTVAIGFIFLLP
eukprot:CAMPEP_0113320982 /NCGR_PEP_ID=MMETSP0010_2-20120614/14620_1 /TAXON_ID=216773 ORGANISM="Corethron hystrix, Strain 308" /NCGR_SAMPLE_ID=MMETSP0010_2 /ASSEMBLY_ACC=CAM_ASM_000155 /LENGTH=231 /DNA_ID=CAMNT_0000178967 /DNA_START=983 /DNA_END=1678 /DNA_ORIENTATION=- /assembly_acc=CAM_ASM_000155